MSDSNKKHVYRLDRKLNSKWTMEEDRKLLAIVNNLGPKNWKHIATLLGGDRTDVQCSHRYGKVLKPGIQKGAWRKDEDAILCREVMLYGDCKVKWCVVAKKLHGRLGKQCRERWFNHLDPSINRGDWTASESRILFEAQKLFGNRWCDFTNLLPGRTENSIKNRWKSSAMTQWLNYHNLVPNSDTLAHVTRTSEEVVEDIKTFRKNLAVFNIRVDLRPLFSLCSIECDETCSKKFLHNGRQLRFNIEDHFDPAELQDVIDENIDSINAMNLRSGFERPDYQWSHQERRSSATTETIIVNPHTACPITISPSTSAEIQPDGKNIFLRAEDNNRHLPARRHHVADSLQLASSERTPQQFVNNYCEYSTKLPSTSVSFQTPEDATSNNAPTLSSSTVHNFPARNDVLSADTKKPRSFMACPNFLAFPTYTGAAQCATCDVNNITEMLRNPHNGEGVEEHEPHLKPATQGIFMNPSLEHLPQLIVADAHARHIHPSYRSDSLHRGGQNCTIAPYTTVMYQQIQNGIHNFQSNHNIQFEDYNGGTLVAHDSTKILPHLQKGTINQYLNLPQGQAMYQITSFMQAHGFSTSQQLENRKAFLQRNLKYPSSNLYRHVPANHDHTHITTINNNLMTKEKISQSCSNDGKSTLKRIRLEDWSGEDQCNLNHYRMAQAPINFRSLSSDCESQLYFGFHNSKRSAQATDPSVCESVTNSSNVHPELGSDCNFDCESDDWDSLFEFGLLTDTDSLFCDHHAIEEMPSCKIPSHGVSNSQNIEQQVSKQLGPEKNLNSNENTDTYKQMLISVHNRIRLSIQQAPIVDQSVFCVPLVEDVPLEALPHFEYLNEISQRSLVKKIITLVSQSNFRTHVLPSPNPCVANGIFSDNLIQNNPINICGRAVEGSNRDPHTSEGTPQNLSRGKVQELDEFGETRVWGKIADSD